MKDLVVVGDVPALSYAVSDLERIFFVPLLLPLIWKCIDLVLVFCLCLTHHISL